MKESNPQNGPGGSDCPPWCRGDHPTGSFHRTSFGSTLNGPMVYLTLRDDEDYKLAVLRSDGPDLNDLTVVQATVLAQLMRSRDERLAGLLKQAVDAAYTEAGA